MPEASMTENDGIVFSEAEVGTARKPGNMKAKAETMAVKAAPEQQFRSGILAPYPGHHP
jgi:hypothetical protein